MNRLEEAMNMDDQDNQLTKDYTTSSLELCKELVNKKATGVELTKAESEFLKAALEFHLHVLMSSFK